MVAIQNSGQVVASAMVSLTITMVLGWSFLAATATPPGKNAEAHHSVVGRLAAHRQSWPLLGQGLRAVLVD